MQNEEISNKTISIYARSASKVLRFLGKHGYNGFKLIKNRCKQSHEINKSQKKQSFKNISKSGQGLSAVDIKESDDIKVFSKVAKEFRLGFAVKKDKETGGYILFFKAKDKEVYDKVFAKYANALEEKGKAKATHKSLTEILSEKKAKAQELNSERVKNSFKKLYTAHEKT